MYAKRRLWHHKNRASSGRALDSQLIPPGHDADQRALSPEAAMVVAREAGGDYHRLLQDNRDSI